MYPRIITHLAKLEHNLDQVLRLCQRNGIDSSFLVVKVLAGQPKIVEKLAMHDIAYLADSRLENLEKYQHIAKKKAYLRLPMSSEIDRVVNIADLSLNSEITTIRKLNDAALKLHKRHDIILMFDLGDLREGIYYQDSYLPMVGEILTLSSISLKGIGVNLTCYGGLIPTPSILNRLIEIKQTIESHFSLHLDLISGGNSSSFYLFDNPGLPKEINSLRYGEIVFMGRETAYGRFLPGLYRDVFTFEAQLIECKVKPSFPDGEIGMNSFGEKVLIEDKGLMNRGILAIGKQDVQLENLFPRDPNVTILGGSSDHMIVDLGKPNYQVGDIFSFDVNYPGLLHLMNSGYVKKIIQ
ncbi:MAG: alanine/ornithine racemase family PLP-dependent enzyme [Candidatus Izemoplasmatales bacterium]|nr:alanine/ornithine racemase family PLP-dependent enzyme [Candidatus Izemoplasmatales bacterium]